MVIPVSVISTEREAFYQILEYLINSYRLIGDLRIEQRHRDEITHKILELVSALNELFVLRFNRAM